MALPWLDLWCASDTHDDGSAPLRRSGKLARTDAKPHALVQPSTVVPSKLTLPDDLILKLQQRDEAAFRHILIVAAPRLIVFAAAIVHSRDVAEDVVQGVMVRMWQLGDRLVIREGTLADYLFGAVRNAALTALRSDQRAQRATLAYRQEAVAESHLESQADGASWTQELAALRQILGTLTEHQRAAVALRYGEGMTITEVATVLEISEKGAEQLLTRIRKVLRSRLVGSSR